MSYEEIKCSYPRGRKSYQCEWCGQSIEPKEKHMLRTYKFEGDFRSGRMHLECETAMMKTDSDILLDGWVFGEMERGEIKE